MHRVLVIDDDPTISGLIELILRLEGYETQVAPDGAAGLFAAARTHPDVMVVDLHLPSISGYEVARQIRAHDDLRKTPLIGLTAMVTDQALTAAWHAGMDAVLTKPFEPDDLIDNVRTFAAASLTLA